MNKPILLSIHPNWADLILSGAKTLELRKTLPLDFNPAEPVKIWLYATAPVKAVIGVVDLAYFSRVHPASLKTDKEYQLSLVNCSCVPLGDILKYSPIYLWGLWNPLRLNTPVRLPEGMRPPQSWCYLGPDKQDFLIKLLNEANDTFSKTGRHPLSCPLH